MNRLTALFGKKHNDILSVFFTAGYPHIDSTVPVIQALASKGVDMVEIGIPFSDPMADGPVIQASSSKALAGGMTLRRLIGQVKEARAKVPDMPFILMGYLNPVMHYGIEDFFRDAHEAGVDGVIIPDLPFDDYLSDFKELSRHYDIPRCFPESTGPGQECAGPGRLSGDGG
ncbi:MAG: tryptophan synthase subunit alpha, partial [Muribaculaceae bacterium]|nr:tryptophan synthase subunit alpha [Muribaculaceae bacterium]